VYLLPTCGCFPQGKMAALFFIFERKPSGGLSASESSFFLKASEEKGNLKGIFV
jgi:hypothetical protein